MSCVRALACSFILPLWAACVVGSPLVDDDEAGVGLGALDCRRPPMCEPRKFEAPSLPPQTPLDLDRCAGHALCAPAGASSDEPAPVDAAARCASEPVDALPLVAECAKQTLHVPDGVGELSYDGAHWTNFELSIESAAPLRVTLHAPELRSVAVSLKGPVLLHVEDAKPHDLRVLGESNAGGEPRVSLLNVEAEQLRVGDRAHDFQGTLTVRASELKVVEVHATEVDLESSRLAEGLVYARGLSAADVSLSKLDVQTEHGLFTEFETQGCRMQLCKYASLIGGRLDSTIVDACPDTLVRVYASIVASSALDGRFEADDSNIENTIFGAAHGSQLISYQSRVSSTGLCGQLDLFAVDTTSIIKCTACEPSFQIGQHACEFPGPPDAGFPIQGNFCPTLRRGQRLVQCSPELPARTRMR